MRLQDYDTSRRRTATVVTSEPLTPADAPAEVREIVFDVDEAGIDIAPGQCIGVLAPGRKEFGQEHHLRLYTAADLPQAAPGGRTRLTICVRRCTYLDEYSGEEYHGLASNYLCDLHPGDSFTVTGPYEIPFPLPGDPEATLLLIGAGTGIAPFRAFLKHLHGAMPDFRGRVQLFHGGRTGLDLLYRNDQRDDFAMYYDRETFEAIAVLSERPHWSDTPGWGETVGARGREIWEHLSDPHTRVYVAGLHSILEGLDAAFATVAGSVEEWNRRKAELESSGRWTELIY